MNGDVDIPRVLQHLTPGARWTLRGRDYDNIEWDPGNTQPKPSPADVEAAWPTVQAAIARERVRAQRQREYEKTTDPLFFAVQRGELGQDEWLAAVERVRADNPYPGPG